MRFLRVGVSGNLLVFATMIILVSVGIGDAAANRPLYDWKPPLTGKVLVSGGVTNFTRCSPTHAVAHKAAYFNLSTGKFGVNESLLADPGTNCPQADSNFIFDFSYQYSFKSSIWGSHVFRSNWWQSWILTLRSVTNNASAPSRGQAQASLQIIQQVTDLTVNTQVGYVISMLNWGVSGNNSRVFVRDSGLSLPCVNAFVFTGGHRYAVDIQYGFSIVVDAQGAGSSAFAELALGTGFHGNSLREIVIR